MNIPQAAECFSLLVTFDSGSRARDENEEPQSFQSYARHVFFQDNVLDSSCPLSSEHTAMQTF